MIIFVKIIKKTKGSKSKSSKKKHQIELLRNEKDPKLVLKRGVLKGSRLNEPYFYNKTKRDKTVFEHTELLASV